MARMPTHIILMSFMDAVRRLERKLRDDDRDEATSFALAAMNTITIAHENLGAIPYHLVDRRVFPFGIGRDVWRFSQATQLEAEYMSQPGTAVTERDVAMAYNDICNEEAGSVIFTDGNVSPAAQREIRRLPIFQSVGGVVHWVVEDMSVDSYTALVTGAGNSTIIQLDPALFRCDFKTKIWDVVPS